MGIKSLFSKAFGGGEKKPVDGPTVEYKGFQITAQPKPQGGQFYTAGRIAKEIEGSRREQYFIRADTHSSADAASDHALSKGRQIIDEQGERLFKEG